MNMKVKGEYRDVITKSKETIQDRGWKSNHISEDLGRFISAIMRSEDFTNQGIAYMAVGSSNTAVKYEENKAAAEEAFKSRVTQFVFPSSDFSKDEELFYESSTEWAWAKPIENKSFLDQNNQSDAITNTLQIDVTFKKSEKGLLGEDLEFRTLEFREFALLGTGSVNKPDNSSEHKIFFINYVAHEPITIMFQKNNENNNYTELTRTVKLTFP